MIQSPQQYNLKTYQIQQNKLDWQELIKKIHIEPKSEGWTQQIDGGVLDDKFPNLKVRIYTKQQENGPLLQTWQEFIVPDVNIDKFMKLINDMPTKKQYDNNILDAKVIKKFDDISTIQYLQFKMPMLISNRDMVMESHCINNKDHLDEILKCNLPQKQNKYYLLQTKSIILEEVPENKDFVRADMFHIAYCEQIDEDKIKFNAISFYDLKGSIPTFIINTLATQGTKHEIKSLLTKYQELESKGQL